LKILNALLMLTQMASSYITKTLMPAYELGSELLAALQQYGGRFWGSAVVRAMHGSDWEPNDIDILVADEEAAAAVEKALELNGYKNKLVISPYHPIITGDIEREPSKKFGTAVPKVWYFQQWIDYLPPGSFIQFRARRVVKVWIGDFDAAMAAADLSCCRVAATVEANGSLKFHGRPDATFRVLYGDPDDGDIYSRVTKYKRRLGIE
jgi:hypothetical protein